MSTSNHIGRTCLVLFLAMLFAALFIFGAAAKAQSTTAQANATSFGAALNSTTSYVDSINQSSYLIFYPNMTAAYNYLSLAKNESQTNTTYAYLLLQKANESAQLQAHLLFRYQQLSLLILIALAILLAAILYFFMRPKRIAERTDHTHKKH